jgi:transposase
MPKKVINNAILKLIRSKLEKGEKNRQISKELNISYDRIRIIANKIGDGEDDQMLLRKFKRSSSENSDVLSRVSGVITRDNSLTQLGVSRALSEFNISMSQSTVSRCLKKLQITRKILSKVPIERNSQRVIDLRYNYVREINVFQDRQFVFLDECGFNLHTSRNYGYSPINTKAYINVPGNRGQNISLMAAISITGIVGYEIIDGAYSGDSFMDFITRLLVPFFTENPGCILIMDNCRFHHRSDVITLLNTNRITYKFLPPYSPMFNPIEEFFGLIKSKYRNIRPLSKKKRDIIERINTIMFNFEGDFVNYYRKVRSFFEMALTRSDFI